MHATVEVEVRRQLSGFTSLCPPLFLGTKCMLSGLHAKSFYLLGYLASP